MSEKTDSFPLQPDAVDVLIREHEAIQRLIHEAMPPSHLASDLERAAFEAERPQRLEALRLEVEAHMVGEERVFYPFLLKFDDFRTLVTRCHEEHRGARAELQALFHELQSPERITKTLLALQSALSQHIDFEERDVFPIFRKRVSRPEREALAVQMNQERQIWKKAA